MIILRSFKLLEFTTEIIHIFWNQKRGLQKDLVCLLDWGARGVSYLMEQLMYFCQGYCKRTDFGFEDEAAF